MNKRKFAAAAQVWDMKWLNPENWHPVNPSHFSKKKLDKYIQRKRALDTYLLTDDSIEEIIRKCGIGRSSLFRLVNRAFEEQPDACPLGYLACVPKYRTKTYERTCTKSDSTAGLMNQFLRSHPDQKKMLDDFALGKKNLNGSTVRGKHYKNTWLKFRNICEDAGINVEQDYPFCNADGGREAVRRYVNKLHSTDIATAARIAHGNDAGRLMAANGSDSPPVTLMPYSRVQLDGHKIDAMMKVRVQDPQGNDQDLMLSRIWLLVLLDVGSRAVLGYSISLSHMYTSNDVLDCIASSFDDWKPMELPEGSLSYHQGAGLPCGVIDGCRMRIFNTLQMDNAWSQLSQRVQERILSAGAIEVITNRPYTARADAYVERFNRTFENLSFHQWPNTTGTGSNDPRRRSPEQAAKRLDIELEDIKLAADVTIANYNAMASKPLHGRSPLEYIQYRLDKDEDLVRYANSESAQGLKLHEYDHPVTIKANLKCGHKPYIQFKHVRYTSTKLMHRMDLVNEKAILRVDARDIRQGDLFEENGSYIDAVKAEPRWLLHPHSVSDRLAIHKLYTQKKLRSDTEQPVSDYVDYKAKQAHLSRKERNELVSLREKIKSQPADEENTNVEKKPRSGIYHRRHISINKTFN